MSKDARFLYTNWRGEAAWRVVTPLRIEFCATKWHPEPQWILHAIDNLKGEERSFALKNIEKWGPFNPVGDTADLLETHREKAALDKLSAMVDAAREPAIQEPIPDASAWREFSWKYWPADSSNPIAALLVVTGWHVYQIDYAGDDRWYAAGPETGETGRACADRAIDQYRAKLAGLTENGWAALIDCCAGVGSGFTEEYGEALQRLGWLDCAADGYWQPTAAGRAAIARRKP